MLQNSYNKAYYAQDICWSITQILFTLALHTILKTSTLQEHSKLEANVKKGEALAGKSTDSATRDSLTVREDTEKPECRLKNSDSDPRFRNTPLKGP